MRTHLKEAKAHGDTRWNRTSAKALRQERAKKQQGGKCGILQVQVRKVSTYEGKRKGSTVQY